MHWEPRNADPFQGDLCGDGSGRWGEAAGLRRCGCFVCELRDGATVLIYSTPDQLGELRRALDDGALVSAV